jgi:hypothetical protein
VRVGVAPVAGSAVGGVTGGCCVGCATVLGAVGGGVLDVVEQPATPTLASAIVTAKNCSKSIRMPTV